MPAETVPLSSQSDGRWRIWYVPIGSNAKSAAILNGATAKSLTYGITGDGWAPNITQAIVEDKRLTLIQNLSRPGKVTEQYEITVVESATVDSADLVLSGLAISKVECQFTVRRAVDNATTASAGQLVDIITGVVGIRRANAPTENGVDTATFAITPTQPTQTGVALIA